jgi:hypothetical protein
VTERSYPEIIPSAGGCTISLNAYEGRAPIRWANREASVAPGDNGWRFLSAIDTTEYLNTPGNLRIADYNEVCSIEPAVIGIWDMPIGTGITIERGDGRIRLIDDASGREITSEYFYVPPQFRA